MFPKHAHSAIICGATGCGKTEFVLDLLETEYKGFFEYVIIICPTWMYNKAYLSRPWFFKDDCVIPMDPSFHVIYYKIIGNSPCRKSDDWLNASLKIGYDVYGKQDSHTLFIIDDCSSDKSMTKKKQMLSQLAFSGRHENCSVWVLTQKYNSVLTDLREQTKWTALFYTKDRDSFDETLRENDVISSSEEKKEIREKLARHKHSKLILITEQPTAYRWEPAKENPS